MYSFKEKLLLFIFASLGLISLWFFISFKSLAFPEYTVDLKINRNQATRLAQETARKLNIDVNNYTNATIFTIDDTAKNFLEQNIGVQKTGKLAQQEVVIWNYNTRFFKPNEKLEYTFSFLPNGTFIGFNTQLPEDSKGENISKDGAQKIAESFLSQEANFNLSNWNLISVETEQKPNRTDHIFVWEEKDFTINDATNRVEVAVFGNKVGSFNQFLKVPDNWLRQYENERSYNNLAQIAAETIAYVFFGIAILATFIIQFRHHQLNLIFARNIAFVIAVITFFATINYFPIILYYFPTTQSFSAFTTEVVLSAFSAAFFSGLITFLAVAAGEVIYRHQFKNSINLAKIIPTGLFTKDVNISLFVGTFTGFIFLAYVVIYYFLGQKVNFWVPGETNYSELFNTYIPWIYPLLVGLSAAVIEEGIFRLFGITFLTKYLKNSYMAIFITSVAWAFLHSSYPQSPWYARGVEISVVGFVLGWLFLRFGIIASITAHYTFNALQTAIFFVNSKDLYITISSLSIALIPLLLAVVGVFYRLKNKTFATPTNFFNTDFKIPKQIKKQTIENKVFPEYIPINKKHFLVLILLAIILTIVAVIFSYNQKYVEVRQHATREKIQHEAESILQTNGIHPSEFMSTLVFSVDDVDPLVEKYFLENEGNHRLTEISSKYIPNEMWTVRFFKPLTKDEYLVNFLSDGSFYSLDYILDENAQGESLNEQQALDIARNYLSQNGHNLATIQLIDQQTEKRPNRTDHYFTFERTDLKFKEASLRINLDILGNKVSNFNIYTKLPENFIRDETSTSFKDIVAQTVISFFLGFILILAVINFLNQFRHHELEIRKVIPFALIISTIFVVSFVNQFSSFYINYETSTSLFNFQIQQLLTFTVGLIFLTLLVLLILASFKSMWENLLAPVLPIKNRYKYLKDAVFISYISLFILIPIGLIIGVILDKFNLVSASNITVNLGFDTYLPIIYEISQLQVALLGFVIVSCFILVLLKYFKNIFRIWVILTLILAISATIGANDLKEFMMNFLPSVSFLVLSFLLIVFVFRKNLLSFVGAIFVSVLLSSGGALLAEPSSFYKTNGIFLILLAFMPLILIALYKLADKTTRESSGM